MPYVHALRSVESGATPSGLTAMHTLSVLHLLKPVSSNTGYTFPILILDVERAALTCAWLTAAAAQTLRQAACIVICFHHTKTSLEETDACSWKRGPQNTARPSNVSASEV